MCLDLSFIKFFSKTASEDIVCYKFLRVNFPNYIRNYYPLKSSSHIYLTPYQNVPVQIGNTYSSVLRRQGLLINQGLHSLVNYKDLENLMLNDCIKVKCIIPKGAKYYVGTFKGFASYASNQIKYLNIIE